MNEKETIKTLRWACEKYKKTIKTQGAALLAANARVRELEEENRQIAEALRSCERALPQDGRSF